MVTKLKSLPWSFWFISIDLFFIFLTALDAYVPGSVRNSILHHFDLGIENNLASWWSAMNFLILGLLAYEFYSTRIDRNMSAWLILAGIFTFLSLDELGSLHERLRSWSYLLPVAALIGLAYLYVLYRLLPNPATRRMAIWIVVGSALVGSVAFQEYVEHILRWPAWARGIRTGFEEGTELLGAFLILWQLIRYRVQRGLVENTTLKAVLADPIRMRHIPVVLLAGFIIHCLFSLQVVYRSDQINFGNPSVWFISALFFTLFCAAFWMFHTYAEKSSRWFWGALAILFLIDSVMINYLLLPRREGSRIYQLGLLANPFFLFAVETILILLGYVASHQPRVFTRIAALVGLALALLLASQVQGLSLEFILIGAYTCLLAFICFAGLDKSRSLEPVVQK